MDPVDQAIKAAAEPQPILLTLGSTGRQAVLPPNITITELADIAGWANAQVISMIIGILTRPTGQTVLDTPSGPVAMRRS